MRWKWGILKDAFRDAQNARIGSYTHLKYPSWGERTHFGNDVLANCGSTIYAPGDGVVEDIVNSGDQNFNSLGNAVIIKHAGQGKNGADIYSLFLHMRDTPNVVLNQVVNTSSKIGVVGTTGSANGICHSHVELRYFANRFSSYNNIYANGSVSNTQYAINNWENPNSYLLKSSTSLSTTPYFDGTGSLVDSAGGCTDDGCTQDYVKLHSHDNQLSSGFFQVLWKQGKCESVELDGLTYADVEVRSWDGYGTDSEYYKLSALPAVVPLKSNQWNLIAVKTTAAIPKGSSRTLKASCVASNYNDSRVSKVEGTPMSFDLDYGWGGNGSIISHSNNKYFGRDRDDVSLLRDKKTLAAFQVTRSSTCQTVRFETPVSFDLSWKTWDAESWQGNRTINNGDTFTLPTNGDWWILKVKAPATGQNGSYVEAICE